MADQQMIAELRAILDRIEAGEEIRLAAVSLTPGGGYGFVCLNESSFAEMAGLFTLGASAITYAFMSRGDVTVQHKPTGASRVNAEDGR